MVIIFNAYAGLAWRAIRKQHILSDSICATFLCSVFEIVSLEVFQRKVAFSEPSLRALQSIDQVLVQDPQTRLKWSDSSENSRSAPLALIK